MVPEIWNITDRIFLSFWTPPPSLNNSENQNFEKMKKRPGDITSLNMCIINDNHMTNGAWDRECNRQNWHMDYFLPFYPPNNQKNQNF